jgi:hypothetical protein
MNRIDYSNSGLASLGRNEDSFLAHVAPGEMVVPPVISDKTKRRIDTELRRAGLDPRNYRVGEYMTINPITGMPEFGFLSKVFKKVKKVAKKVAPYAGIIAAPFTGGLSAALIGGAGGLLSGKGLKGAALGALGGFGANAALGKLGLTASAIKGSGGLGAALKGIPTKLGINTSGGLKSLLSGQSGLSSMLTGGGGMSGMSGMQGLGTLLGGQPMAPQMQNMFGGLNRFGQFTRGLGGIADTVFQGLYLKRLLENMKNEKDPSELVPTGLKAFDTYSNVGDFGIGNLDPMLVSGAQYVNQSPDMAGKGNKVITAKYGGMVDKYMGGGIIDQYKHGGIYDKDDGPGDIAPAMLEPGEFVLTRDAVKGAGGPEVLYPLMAQLEARA